MRFKLPLVLLLLGAVLAIPFLLRPSAPKGAVPEGETERLVILPPHNETIKPEWEPAFRKDYRICEVGIHPDRTGREG